MSDLTQQTETEAEMLRSALLAVIADAEGALRRMDAGGRPSYTTSGTIFGSNVENANRHAARLDMLLNFAGSDLLPMDSALDALRNAR